MELVPIEITEYTDKLKPYLNKFIGNKNIKRGNFIDNENFESICLSFVYWFEKNKNNIVNNMYSIYKLTGNQFGHNVALENWEFFRNWKGVGDTEQFSKESIYNSLIENIGYTMIHLYQKNTYKKEDNFRSGVSALLATISLTVDIKLSEKRNTKDINFYYNISINLPSGNDGIIECEE